MEYIAEVLIKEQHESGIDQVFIVKNLPKHLLYRKVAKMVQKYDRDGYTDGTLVPSKDGEKVEALLEGLEESQNGDGSIVFSMGGEPGRNALLAIDTYIKGTLPRDVVIPSRVPYPLDPSDSRSMPKSKVLIPVVELPVQKAEAQVSPEVKSSLESSAPIKQRKPLTEQQKLAAKERLARAREIKKQMKVEPQA